MMPPRVPTYHSAWLQAAANGAPSNVMVTIHQSDRGGHRQSRRRRKPGAARDAVGRGTLDQRINPKQRLHCKLCSHWAAPWA